MHPCISCTSTLWWICVVCTRSCWCLAKDTWLSPRDHWIWIFLCMIGQSILYCLISPVKHKNKASGTLHNTLSHVTVLWYCEILMSIIYCLHEGRLLYVTYQITIQCDKQFNITNQEISLALYMWVESYSGHSKCTLAANKCIPYRSNFLAISRNSSSACEGV